MSRSTQQEETCSHHPCAQQYIMCIIKNVPDMPVLFCLLFSVERDSEIAMHLIKVVNAMFLPHAITQISGFSIEDIVRFCPTE
jgi:hypothetical protein